MREREACPGTRPGPAQPPSTEVLTQLSFVENLVFLKENKDVEQNWASGGSETLTGFIDRDFGALWELLEALILASSDFYFLLARSLVFRAPFSLAFEPLGSKSELPTGLLSSPNRPQIQEKSVEKSM